MFRYGRDHLLLVSLFGLLLLVGALASTGSMCGSQALDQGGSLPTPAWPLPTPLVRAGDGEAEPTPAQPAATPTHDEDELRPLGLEATTWYVDASILASGDGRTPGTAFKTITEATTVALSGDTIRVAAGRYTEAISLPSGVQMIGAGWRETIVDTGGVGTVVYQGANSLLEGFTVTGSGGDFFDTGVWISEGPATLRNNCFTGNQSGVFLWCFSADCPEPVEFRNNIFDHNTMAGIASNSLHHFSIINNTFVDNGTALPATRDFHTILNNVVVGNGVGINGEAGYSPMAHYNLVWGNDTNYRDIEPGVGDVSADPLFADADSNDYSLLADSAGRDNGDPSAQYNDLDGTRNDMGVFGGPLLIDDTPPPAPLVHDRGEAQPFTSRLQITWDCDDLQSGLLGYQVALGTAPAASDSVPWMGLGSTASYTFTGLSLVVGETYYASVQGQNGMGDWSPVGSSDGVLIDPLADDDLAPPVIDSVTYATPAHIATPVGVTASIHDQGEVRHGVAQVTLFYGYTPPYSQGSAAGAGPGGSNDGLWTFSIPAQGVSNAGQKLHFWLQACDADDSPACAADDNDGQYYQVAISADLSPEPFRVDHSPELCDYPDIQGQRVVAEDHRGPGIEVYGWDIRSGQEFTVIHDDPHQHFPVIYGDVVAYTDLRYSTTGLDGTDIFARNLATGEEFTVTTAPGQQINLAIGPRYIIWEDDRDGNTGSGGGSNRDIYGYDMLTGEEFPIATGPGTQITPDLDGNRVVWSADGNIVGRDLDTGADFLVSDHWANQLRPAIRGDLVVWEDWRNGNWDIYSYRFSTGEEQPLAIAPGDQNYADLSDDLVVWQDERHGNWDVYVHVLETGEQFAVSRNARKQKWPAVDGTTVVWSDFLELEPQIYGFVYDGALPASAYYAIEDNPTNLVVGAFPGGPIQLTWQDNSDEESGYVIERHTGMLGVDYQIVATLPANATSYADADTQVNTPYWYRVYAVSPAGRSATSNESYNLALPAQPFPNEQERYMQVLINQVRADPAAFGYPSYPPQPPVVYQANLNWAARAHTTVSSLPGGSGGHVDWADRGPGERAVASGFDHAYVSENMGGGGPTATEVAAANQMFLDSHGHRDNMLGAGTLETGLGYFFLWSERHGGWVETFGGREGLSIPYLPAGSVAPFAGRPGHNFAYLVNYYHPAGLPPIAAQVVVDGVAREMTPTTGSAGNATYRYATTLAEGEGHTYHFQFSFSDGTARLPASGSFSGPRVLGDAPDLDVTWLTVPANPWPVGEPGEISAAIYNAGTLTASDAIVRFYLGNPETGGGAIGEARLTIPPQGSRSAALTWTPLAPTQDYLYAVADPENLIAEWSEENNLRRAQVSIYHSHGLHLPVMLRGY